MKEAMSFNLLKLLSQYITKFTFFKFRKLHRILKYFASISSINSILDKFSLKFFRSHVLLTGKLCFINL